MSDENQELKDWEWRNVPVEQRFALRYEIAENGCWNWTGAIHLGYGEIRWKGRLFRAHQIAYLLFKGDVPEGLEIDHLCENRRCVNPDHLEAVTHQVNIARGRLKTRQSHCNSGHPLSGENLGWHRTQGTRFCIACSRANAHRQYRKKREKECRHG